MKELFEKILNRIDEKFLWNETESLWRKEFGQTYKDYHAAAFHVKELLEKLGIPNVEMHEFPADGESTFLDARMPLAWDATIGKLILDDGIVVADYAKHPFMLVKGSVLEGGKRHVKIISANQLLSGADTKDALVLLDAGDKPDDRFIGHILDLGALGFISDGVSGDLEYPDSLGWFNAATEDGEWHVVKYHRPFLGFSISPRMGVTLRKKLKNGELKATAECDGVLYPGVHHAVTALIPGKSEREVWAYAHLYEPMVDDDSAGVIAAIETAKQIMAEGTPEYSVRLVFAMELYGFMAYIAKLGGNIHERVVGGLNFDALFCTRGVTIRGFRCPAGTPFFGNYIVDELISELQGTPNAFEFSDKGSAYHDDMMYAVPSIGLPLAWNAAEHKLNHHTSRQTMEILDLPTFRRATAYNASLVFAFANPTEETFEKAIPAAKERIRKIRETIGEKPFGNSVERFRYLCGIERKHLLDFKRVLPDLCVDGAMRDFDDFCAGLEADLPNENPQGVSKWRDYAAKIRMKYTAVGLPISTVKLPRQFSLPGGSIYGPIANIIANLHREMSLADAIRLAEYETGRELSEDQIRRHINALNILADAGYFEVTARPEITKDDIVAKLRDLGVRQGDLLLVHSAVSACGYIRGGMQTVLSALQEVVGENGTLLFPAFTRPYTYLGGPCREWDFRPYDAKDPTQIWTGGLPKFVLKNCPDVKRSRHVSHSWCGFGPLAEECLTPHQPGDPPCSANSPLGIALKHNAKILHFGSMLASTTFLHYVEDECDVPFLGDAVCAERLSDGSIRMHAIRKHLPGDRDFYYEDETIHTKIFRAMLDKGLHLSRQKLGIGELCLLNMQELHDLARQLVTQDYRILLRDDQEKTQ